MDYKKRPQPYHLNKDWYKARNRQIVEDKDDDMTWREMQNKYGISSVYLMQIYKRLKSKGGK